MKKVICIILSLFLMCALTAEAQNSVEFNVKSTNKQLEQIEKRLNSGQADSKTISEDLKTLNVLQNELNQAKFGLNEKLQNVQKRITALGEAPKDGVKEAAEISANRKNFLAEEEEVKAKLAQAELINTKIEEINNLILKVRNQTLLNRILVRQTSIFQVKDFGRSLWSFMLFIYEIIKSPYSWYQNLSVEQKNMVNENGIRAGLVFIFVLLVAVSLNIYIRRRFGYRDCAENPTYAMKVQSATAMAFSFGLIPAVFLGALLIWLKDTEVINAGNLGRLLHLATLYLLAFFLILAAVRVIFVPKCGAWRIVNMEDKKAKAVSRGIVLSAGIVLVAQFLLQFALDTNADEDIIYALRIAAITAKVFMIVIVIRRFFYIQPQELVSAESGEVTETLSTEAKITLLITVFAFVTLIISLFGYVRLSEYIVNRFIYSIAAVGLFWLADKLLRFVMRQILRLRFWVGSLHISPRFLAKIEFWFSILLKPLLWLAAAIAILGIWGFSVDIMLHDIKNFLLGFNIGGMHISIISLLLGVGTFFVSLFIFKSLKRSVQSGQLSKIDMAEDSRNSLAAGIGLIGFIVSLMIAFAVMGGSLSSIALIAGALSFGVGLGMQNIVSNFVSGIIIIFERPIKIGDWVIISGQEGIVKTINMRSTLLESFNKSDVIIPNSTILSGTLINMTYSNRVGRVDIKLAVNFHSNVQNVKNTLLEIAQTTPGVLSNPAPNVAFLDISGNQLIFQLNCFTANVYNRQNIADMIREKVISVFAQNNIMLPGAKNS